jgi:hypothetical protein
VGLAVAGAVATSACASAGRTGDENAATPSDASPASRSVHPVTTVIVTDDPVVSAAGVSAETSWSGLLARSLDRNGSPMALSSDVVDSAGFADDESPGRPSFSEVVADTVVHSTQLVIFFDTQVGAAGATAVGEGAAEAFRAVEEAAPDALIVVVGPYRMASDGSAPDEELRRAVRGAAQGAEVAVTYVDPVDEAWPAGASQQLIADLLFPHVAPLVRALAESGAFE